MTVYANKPAFNVREKLKEIDRKPGDFGGKTYKADSSDEWNKITNLEASPLPYWTGYYGTVIGQTTQTHTFLDSGNQRYYTVNNGNNGPNARFRMHGVLRGEFELGYTGSYSWGYSGIWAIPRSNFDPLINHVIDSNGPHARTFNNSSNNHTKSLYKTDYGQASYSETTALTPGVSSGMFKIWRNAAGMIYFRPPNNGTDYALFSSHEDIFITNEAQAPNFIKLEYVLCPSH
jgi:hypothetical protein